MATIPAFHISDDIKAICSALDEAGCVVVAGVLDESKLNQVTGELESAIQGAYYSDKDQPQDFYPSKTKRLVGVMEKMPSVRALCVDPLTTKLCDHHVGPNCEQYQLHVASALVVGPGAREQILHREEDPFDFFPVPRPNLILASMIAITDFTAANGGTLLVPGSHKWPEDRVAQRDEIVAAEMTAGSVLFWLGGTLHGAGANVTEEWRHGVILTYSLGWLRQEENQYMDLSDETLRGLSSELKERLGITMHDESLGFFDPKIRGV